MKRRFRTVGHIRKAAYIRMRKGKRIPSPGGEGRVRGSFPWHGVETDRQTESRPGKAHGFRAFKEPQVRLYHVPPALEMDFLTM